MKDKLFIALGKLAFAVLCILAFLAVGKFVGCGIITAWDRQAKAEADYIENYKAELKAEQNKD